MPKGFDWFRFCLHGTLLPAGGEGGRRKQIEPHDGKKSPIPTSQKSQQDFCFHAALGRLRFVSSSTAQLLYLIDFSMSGTGVRVKIHGKKSVRVGVKNALQKGWGLRFERIASTASVCTLAEKRCSVLPAEAPFFYFGIVPNPLLLFTSGQFFPPRSSRLLPAVLA